MTTHCPSCDVRLPRHPMATARGVVSCRACGHRWRAEPVYDALIYDTIDVTDAEPQRHSSRELAKVIDHDDGPDVEASRLVLLAREAQEEHQLRQARRRRKLQQWAVFGSLVLSPFLAAAAMPETVVSAAPVSIRAYEALGYDINIYGLEVRGLERQHVVADGQRILSIKGYIANVDTDLRKIPWLRFALTGPAGEELYTWTLDTSTKPALQPGESTSFVTRISAPPEAAQNLQIRFARADEIGLKQGHDQP
jgi:hypothetical protein